MNFSGIAINPVDIILAVVIAAVIAGAIALAVHRKKSSSSCCGDCSCCKKCNNCK